MSEIRVWAQARSMDRTLFAVVGVADLLLCCVLLLMSVGVVGPEPTTRAEETSAWHSAAGLYLGWLVIGAVLFLALRMTRSLLAHVAMMILSPVLAFLLILSLPALS
ncbi:hypothetical protein ABZ930_08170 [Streptomyces sp. NPDC046716]|uniref:hypothetical protein n=1 Tax=Streptomyces sp. NPDC046716 TaxID=3157093 RepID=UPI0033C84FFD